MGGPLMPDLDTALRHYPHSEVKLEGGMRHAVPTFLQQQGIDILVVGDQWPQSGLQLSSGASAARVRAGGQAGGMGVDCLPSLPGATACTQSRPDRHFLPTAFHICSLPCIPLLCLLCGACVQWLTGSSRMCTAPF